jgi:excisionase family DNA binding protein
MKLKGILKPEEVAEIFGVKVETVLEWREKGLPWINLGKMVLISETGLYRWLKSLEKTKNAQDASGQDFFGQPMGKAIPQKK